MPDMTIPGSNDPQAYRPPITSPQPIPTPPIAPWFGRPIDPRTGAPVQPGQGFDFPPPPAPPKRKHTVRNVVLIVVAGLVALCGVGTIVAAAASSGKPTVKANATPTCDVVGINGCTHKQGNGGGPVPWSPDPVQASPLPPATTKAAPTTPAAPKLTMSQQQALVMAREYLATQAFSRSGLIKQLQYEGFSAADATYGVDAAGADWTAQADAMAKEYLSTQAFSRSGLIEQLEYEGFTAAQAQHGVAAAGL